MAKTGNKKGSQKRWKEGSSESIYYCVKSALNLYFQDLDGHDPSDLYELVLTQVEKPVLEVVLKQTQGNITRSAGILGINRATLRKKLKKYALE